MIKLVKSLENMMSLVKIDNDFKFLIEMLGKMLVNKRINTPQVYEQRYIFTTRHV